MAVQSRSLILGVFFGVVAVVASRVAYGNPAVDSASNHIRLDHSITNQQGGIPIKISVRKHDIEPEYEVDQQEAAAEPEPDSGPAPTDTRVTRPRGPVAATCETPPQWEGRATEWDHLKGGNNRFNITFDGVGRRKRIMEDKHAQLPGKRIYEYIMLYDDGYQFVINHNYNTCTIAPLGTWRNHTIPENATLEDYYEIGAPGSGFMVQEWSDRIPGRQRESWIGTYTDKGCWPVMEIFMEKAPNYTMVQSVTTRFFDLSVGIKDPTVFSPPSYCPQPGQESRVRPNQSARPADARPPRRKLTKPERIPSDLNRKLSIIQERVPAEADRVSASLRLGQLVGEQLREEGRALRKKVKSSRRVVPGRSLSRTIKITGK